MTEDVERFVAVVADPPYPFGDSGIRGGVAKHYETMTFEELVELGAWVQTRTAPSCHLYLWTPNSFIGFAWKLCEEWGFTPKGLLTWVKIGKDSPTNLEAYGEAPIRPRIGTGHYFRNSTEQVIFGIRGKPPLRLQVHNLSTVFFAPRGAHSEKPAVFYDLVEAASPGPYLELFSRKQREGWTGWGNEVDWEPTLELAFCIDCEREEVLENGRCTRCHVRHQQELHSNISRDVTRVERDYQGNGEGR